MADPFASRTFPELPARAFDNLGARLFKLRYRFAECIRPDLKRRWLSRSLPPFALLGAILLPALPAFSGNPPVPLLTNVVQIRKLTNAEAEAGQRIQVTGVITYYDHGELLFIQDSTGGIYAWPANIANSSRRKPEIQAGDLVEVQGVTRLSGYSPIITEPEFKVLGKAPMPEARKIAVAQLMTGEEDSQWVEIEGIVRAVTSNGGMLSLELVEGGNRVMTMVSAGQAEVPPYLDNKIRVRGVCGVRINERGQLTSVYVLASDLSYITVLEPAATDEGLRVQPISALSSYSPRLASGHRLRVRGTVTLQADQKTIFIQDATGGLRVALQRAFQAKAGDQLEVIGFPQAGEYAPVLEDAAVTLLGHGVQPVPFSAKNTQIQAGHFNASLVRVQGRILDRQAKELEQALLVQSGPIVFKATLKDSSAKDPLSNFINGSLVEITGICQSQLNGFGDHAFRLLLDSPADIRVLKNPSWWTARRLGWTLGTIVMASLAGAAWVVSLGKQVRQRTRELVEEIDHHKRTEAKLEREIAERKRMEAEVEKTHKELLVASRQAGMAEVATGVLHNVGNVLNSVNVSATLVADNVRKSKVASLAKAVALMREHGHSLATFISSDPKGQQLPGYLAQLSDHMAGEQAAMLQELTLLQKNIEHIKDIVAMQQSYARVSGLTETVTVSELVDDALRMNAGVLTRHHVQSVREFEQVPSLTTEKHKVLQILVNLIGNAKSACDQSDRPDKRLTIRVANGNGRVKISVADNGIGIPPENLTRIFNHGFTTKKDGHGFGLHSGALAAKEMGGSLSAYSGGVGTGAMFTLELPVQPTKVVHG